MKFRVMDGHRNIYLVYGVNFHMAGANPTIQFCMYSEKDRCWMVDDAANYIPEDAWEFDEYLKRVPNEEDEEETIGFDIPVIDTDTGETVFNVTENDLKGAFEKFKNIAKEDKNDHNKGNDGNKKGRTDRKHRKR